MSRYLGEHLEVLEHLSELETLRQWLLHSKALAEDVETVDPLSANSVRTVVFSNDASDYLLRNLGSEIRMLNLIIFNPFVFVAMKLTS